MNSIHSGLLSAALASVAALAGKALAEEGATRSSQPVDTGTTAQAESRPSNCVRDTGSRIKPKNDECLGVAGRGYSAEYLQQTGASSVGEALRRVDPSISGGR